MSESSVKLSPFCQVLKRIKAYILLIGLFCFSLQYVVGQDQRVADSLVKIYQEDNLEGIEKFELLRNLAFNNLNDRELALGYAEELIQLSELEKNNYYLFRGLLIKGEYYNPG